MGEEDKSYKNINKECVKCEQTFVFSKGEQEFYARKGFPAPKICPECRDKRRKRKQKEERL